MKNLITTSLLFVAFATFAQKPVKITTNVDEFTGDTSIYTEAFSYQDPIGGQAGLKFMAYYQDDGYYIVSILNMTELSTMDAGDQMVIKLADGTMITVAALEYAVSEYVSSNYYRIVTVYPISLDDLTVLASTPIDMVRIHTSDGNQDRAPSKKTPAYCMAAFGQFVEYVR